MSTRATIACKQEDGRYAAIYLHFDGYQDHAGRVLKEHYTSIESARTLVAGGDILSPWQIRNLGMARQNATIPYA
jgi:hypothetical protein